ncbi:protein kinase domain-containing protein [Aliikangiella sp. IMCC44653]
MSKSPNHQANTPADNASLKYNASAHPKSIGRYQIHNEVGQGATALVYKAYDPQLDRFIAIKVLRKSLARNDTYRKSFIHEARLAAQLTHPGIVTIFDVGIADSMPYIAMELLEGATLEQILKAQGQLNLRTMLGMALQLSQALAYAHKQGVVHRDIKPGNIIVLKDKKTVKLTDFGIAIVDDKVNREVADQQKVLGTPEYMAPEQVLGKEVDNRSDLYSVGVLIYRALMGLPPFISEDLGQLFKQIIKAKPPLVHVKEEQVADDVQDLLRRLLQKKPHKRFQSAHQLSKEIRLIQAKLGEKPKQETKQYTSLRLRWTVTMAGVVFAAMCISLAIVYFVQNHALSGITFDYGRSIARMIAFESSAPILLDDNVGLNALVTESSKNEQLKSVFVMDNQGIILASTDSSKVGLAFAPPQERSLEDELEQTLIYKRHIEDKKVLFDIAMPIKYADKTIGELYISFSADSMYVASKTTLITMLIVMMLTLFVVFILTLILARRTSKDFQRITQALLKMSHGRIDARLISQRNDEAGQMFDAFNQLAAKLEGLFDAKSKKVAIKLESNNFSELAKAQNIKIDETVELDIKNLSNQKK